MARGKRRPKPMSPKAGIRGILPTSATVADVYVAINSQYHDYAELFKNWFGVV